MHAVTIAHREIDISKHSSYYIRGDYGLHCVEVIGSWLVLKHRYMRRTSHISMVEALTLILLFNNS